jgi:uncharacterized protein (TIGR02996 family)
MNPTTEGLIRAAHANPNDSLPYMVLADFLEEGGDEKHAHALRFAVEHGAHDRAVTEPDGYTASTEEPGVHLSPSGVHVNLPGKQLVLPVSPRQLSHDLLRRFRALQRGNEPRTREEHKDPSVFDRKHHLLRRIAFANRFFGARPEQRMVGAKLEALLNHGSEARIAKGAESDYGEEFTVKLPGHRRMPLVRAWHYLPQEQRASLLDNLRTHPESPTDSPEHWTHTLREHRGNGLSAAVDNYLSSGHLFREEHKFPGILHEAGLPGVSYHGLSVAPGGMRLDTEDFTTRDHMPDRDLSLRIDRKKKGTPTKLQRLPAEDMSPAALAAAEVLAKLGAPNIVKPTPGPMKPVPGMPPSPRKKTRESDYLTRIMGQSGRRILGEDELAHALSLHAEGHHPVAIADALARKFPERPVVSGATVSRAVGYKRRKPVTELQAYALHLAAQGHSPKNIRLLVALHPKSKAKLPAPLRLARPGDNMDAAKPTGADLRKHPSLNKTAFAQHLGHVWKTGTPEMRKQVKAIATGRGIHSAETPDAYARLGELLKQSNDPTHLGIAAKYNWKRASRTASLDEHIAAVLRKHNAAGLDADELYHKAGAANNIDKVVKHLTRYLPSGPLSGEAFKGVLTEDHVRRSLLRLREGARDRMHGAKKATWDRLLQTVAERHNPAVLPVLKKEAAAVRRAVKFERKAADSQASRSSFDTFYHSVRLRG